MFVDSEGKQLAIYASKYLDDLETAIKESRHLAEIGSTERREVILGDSGSQDEDNRTI